MIKQRDKSKKHNAILDAAVIAFEEMGFDRASMDYIAEKADASKRTVYNHFASKEILFNAVIERFIAETVEQKQIQYQADEPIVSQLYKFADLKVNLSSSPEQLRFVKMAFGVMMTHPNIAAQVLASSELSEDGFQVWLNDAVKDGKLVIDDIALAAEVFWSMFTSTFFWMPMLQGQVEPSRAETLKKEFVATFLARYQP